MRKYSMRYLLTLLIIGMFFATTTAISDNVNETSEVVNENSELVMYNNPPISSFYTIPASPFKIGQEVTFFSTSADPDGAISHYAWNFDWPDAGDTAWTAIAKHTYNEKGTVVVSHWVAGDKYDQQTPPRSDQHQIQVSFEVVGKGYPITVTEKDTFSNTIVVDDEEDGFGDKRLVSFPSGTCVPVKHTCSSHGTYMIQVKARDTYLAESGFTTFELKMPKFKSYTNIPLLNLLETHPNLFPLLRQFLEL